MDLTPKQKDNIYRFGLLGSILVAITGMFLFNPYILGFGFFSGLVLTFLNPAVELTMAVKNSSIPLDEIDICMIEELSGKIKYELGIFSKGKKVISKIFGTLSEAEFYKNRIIRMLPYTRGSH